MPILMGVIGFVFFVLFAALYNGLAKWLGGVELEVKDTVLAAAAASPGPAGPDAAQTS